MKKEFGGAEHFIEDSRMEMANALAKMVGIKAISPISGGAGEGKRADFLQRMLQGWGFAVKRYTYIDETGTERPNLVTVLGNNKRTLWIITHTDTVSEGDRSAWKTDPFKGVIKNGKVFGRGTNDNGQEVIASIFALRALKESGSGMKRNLGVVLAADEELGSEYGMGALVRKGIFGKRDMFIVPDSGNAKGDEIEISEKSTLWLRVTVLGKQVHASTPQDGVNAYRYAIRFLNEIDEYMHKKYKKRDKLFITPSTFEMTKHEKNLDSTNIIPGKEVSYIDCRILPRYRVDSVLNDMRRIAKAKRFGKARIIVDVFEREDATRPTSEKSEIVRMLKRALKKQRGIRAKCVGIGGGTVAKPLRKLGMQVAVWSTQHDIAHQPNEYAEIDHMVADAKTFAFLCTG
ncbi:MAG: M20 family metallo-hydrolase [Candidatus Micrarchaeota archaeon]|nr:M20 family metallo-hydrolase [Candidatus Micrarchaeota archaeon]